ncbi:hypothetical protein [Micromonospora sp. NPDC049107]|uniref:hypothetical protein n=1 Tax=Micromonospora sp. NPDC049107 TaxID=3154349 RepID=UPI0033F4E75C
MHGHRHSLIVAGDGHDFTDSSVYRQLRLLPLGLLPLGLLPLGLLPLGLLPLGLLPLVGPPPGLTVSSTPVELPQIWG